METKIFTRILSILKNESRHWNAPIVTLVAQRSHDPYQILISTLLSLRTKDETTTKASQRLFAKAKTPYEMVKLNAQEIAVSIYPVGFYKRKAETILKVSEILIMQYRGKVPDTLEELLALPGVGRKTANLVLTLGHGKPGICVDTHVHRITNRLGYVVTKTPEQTEMELRKILHKKWWTEVNDILVAFGQTLCKPISPLCTQCPVESFCAKKGVIRSR